MRRRGSGAEDCSVSRGPLLFFNHYYYHYYHYYHYFVGCYESDMLVAVDGKAASKAYDGFDILCSATGFKYERAGRLPHAPA